MAKFLVTLLIAAWGAFYSADGQSAKDIKQQLFHPEMTDSEFALRSEESDYYKSAFSSIDGVLQAFSIPFTDKGSITFAPNEFKLGEFKIDTLFTPDEVRGSWLGFWQELSKPERKTWGLIRWAIEKMIIPKSKEEYETDVAWYGWQITEYGTASTNTTTFARVFSAKDVKQPANGAMDGLWIHMLKNLARINVIATGAVNADAEAWCTQVETFADDIDAPLRRKIDKLFMSETNYNHYIRGRRKKYNEQYKAVEDLTVIEYTTIKVAWLRSMDGSDKIWGTPKDNRVRPTHKDNNGVFDIQGLDRQVKALTDWKKAIGFDVPEYVVTNDLENTIAAQTVTDRYAEA
jgi:hypothetical protein